MGPYGPKPLDPKIQAKLDAHDDYLSAIKTMAERVKTMRFKAHQGDPFARGYIAALDHFALEVQAQLARRIS